MPGHTASAQKNITQYQYYKISLLAFYIVIYEDTPLPRLITLLSLTVLCPEDSQSQETQSSDLTSTLYTLRDGVVGMMEELLTGEGGFQDLIKVITRSSFEAEPN